MKPFTTLGAAVFALMALVHLYRLVRPFEIMVAGTAVPQSISIAGFAIAAILSILLWREARR